MLDLMAGPTFNWWYSDNSSFRIQKDHPDSTNFSEYGFSHKFWDSEKGPNPSESFIQPLLFQILDVTDCDFIIRARADMVTWSKEEFIHLAHRDFAVPNTASVFYVNESDGDTIFYNVNPNDNSNGEVDNLERVSPKANRLVLFDGNLVHTGCSPTKHKNRILINSNYIKKEYKEIAEVHSET